MSAFRRLRLAAVLLVAAIMLVSGAPGYAAAHGASTRQTDETVAIGAARERVAAGDVDGAIRGLAKFVAEEPETGEAMLYLGDLEYGHGDALSAELRYRAILEDAPEDRETHDHLGRLYASRGRTREAIVEFGKTLPSASGYRHLVELHRRRGDLDAFVARYRRAADARPADAPAQYAMGTIARGARLPAEAVRFLERAVRLAPSCDAFSELGNADYDLGHFPAAIESFERCLTLEPDDYSASLDLGNTYITLGDKAKARRLFERAIALVPDRSEALVDLGYLDDMEGSWQRAVDLYLRAIAVDPLIPEAYVDLGYDYDSHELFARAETAYHFGLAIAPDFGRLHYLLGDTYLHEGKRSLALGEYRRAADSDEADVARAASHELMILSQDVSLLRDESTSSRLSRMPPARYQSPDPRQLDTIV